MFCFWFNNTAPNCDWNWLNPVLGQHEIEQHVCNEKAVGLKKVMRKFKMNFESESMVIFGDGLKDYSKILTGTLFL